MVKKEKIIITTVISLSILSIGIAYYFFNKDNINKKIKDTFKSYEWFNTSLKWYRKPKNKSIVEKLHPFWRDKVKEFLSYIEKNTDYDVILTSGCRSFEKQKSLDNKNSNNADAGLSYHNYCLALDLNLINRKTGFQLMKKHSKSLWLKSGIPQIAKNKFNFIWGGDFKSYNDPIHFRPKKLPSTKVLLANFINGKTKNGFVKLAA